MRVRTLYRALETLMENKETADMEIVIGMEQPFGADWAEEIALDSDGDDVSIRTVTNSWSGKEKTVAVIKEGSQIGTVDWEEKFDPWDFEDEEDE